MNTKSCILLLSYLSFVLAAPKLHSYSEIAKPCDTQKCKLPNCLCSSTDIPANFTASKIPQIVLLTFDDAIQQTNLPYYEKALFNRTNPDGCSIQATYFLSHEYTDYSVVNNLYSNAHEIALHSISHKPDPDYWRDATIDSLNDEFLGERQLINHFANVPMEEFKGVRIPFLQLSGNTSFEMINKAGLTYDCTWPTQHFMNPPLWPYTLEYKSTQDCEIGPCPDESLPKTWVVPMVNWEDDAGVVCSMVDACANIPKDVDGLLAFMKKNFDRHYKTNRAPFGFFVHAAWFIVDDARFQAYLKFLDYIQKLPDVYITSISRMLEWVQKPSDLEHLKDVWPTCPKTVQPNCQKNTCKTMKGEEERWFTFCGTQCPDSYPWVGNPFGNKTLNY